MIRLDVSAETFDELKEKVFSVLGMAAPTDVAQNVPVTNASSKTWMNQAVANTEAWKNQNAPAASTVIEKVAQAPAPLQGLTTPVKRHRRTKAEIEAAEAASQQKDVSVEDVEVDVDAEEAVSVTAADCKDILSKIVAKPGKGMAEAIKVVKQFDVKKVTELKPTQYLKFMEVATEVLNS